MVMEKGKSASKGRQSTILDLMENMKKKPKLAPEGDEVKHEVIGTVITEKCLPKKCYVCGQQYEDLKIYEGGPEGALEEAVALTDSSLSLFTGEEECVHEDDSRPQVKITGFLVYDTEGHLVPFDTGLLEKGKKLYFSGYLKPIDAEDPSEEDGIPGKGFGPLAEWWLAGFDGGEKALLGFSTAFADYFLMDPATEYASYYVPVQQKMYLAKAVIEYLSDNMENMPTYEDLMGYLETTSRPPGIPPYSADALMEHAAFVLDQVQSMDEEDSEDAPLFIAPCMQDLAQYSGYVFGQPRGRRTRLRVKQVREKKKFTKATTTPLVRAVFETVFAEVIDGDTPIQTKKKTRCGVCEKCQAPDCGSCKACKDMLKFGGTGRSKQACVLRKCPNADAEDSENLPPDDFTTESESKIPEQKPKRRFLRQITSAKGKWIVHALPYENMENRKNMVMPNETKSCWVSITWEQYEQSKLDRKVQVNGHEVNAGDAVAMTPSESSLPMVIARIVHLFENIKNEEMMCHVHWYRYVASYQIQQFLHLGKSYTKCPYLMHSRGSETVLGGTSYQHELFLIPDCEDISISSICRPVQVEHVYVDRDMWEESGGKEIPDDILQLLASGHHDDQNFTCRFRYIPELGRFLDPPNRKTLKYCMFEEEQPYCWSCNEKKLLQTQEIPKPLLKLDEDKGNFTELLWRGEIIHEHDCLLLDPQAFSFKFQLCKQEPAKKPKKLTVDEDMYPEHYRKGKIGELKKGSNDDTPEPFRVAQVLRFVIKSGNIFVHLRKFYRPQNVPHVDEDSMALHDWYRLYWSEEEATVPFESVRGKCFVIHDSNLSEMSPHEWCQKGPLRFYVSKGFDGTTGEFYDPPSQAIRLGAPSKGGKVKGKSAARTYKSYDTVPKKLRTLDIFAGCGGLSEGLHESGVAESLWAVEILQEAADAFKYNNPKSTVFTDDCNELLNLILQKHHTDGSETNAKKQKLPKKGEVDLLVGGPPCQGFSGMNRFNEREASQFKNSLIVTYLSYLEYFRPRYFILENVRNFISFKKSMILKLTMRCLVTMGYQCSFGVLQAGQYGVPQTRRRAIILAAAPGEVLPNYPEPLHVFSEKACKLNVLVDDTKFEPMQKWQSSAPYQTVTVYDAISDLPEISSGASRDTIPYGRDPLTTYQQLMRGDGDTVKDHITKEMAPIMVARIMHIPTTPGSDWRDLPNISVRLSDGTYTKKLIYAWEDKKNGRSSTGAMRGVCSCVTGRKCDPNERQFGTLIPWCLPHTGNRHNHWAGLFGRLTWNGYFSTTITNPEPMGKQGVVLHPSQHRLVSVRECARSQGFPDHFRFHGSSVDRHRQVGNAVPPPMAKAIGHEFIKAMLNKMSTE
ncbi:unnamed protein product [Darwinula stevensoni]|uniref:DNA (cytosine-5)-methyltransferase n=1 Tax=Darwinula stevensoni TaxID=69355 RepID=A0A7R8X5B0_9CRUS|nr:unnamed protein product [Darwinula stevensoni]CAG0886916.1 unnamed protein product [Darwinula stevensoni]